MRSFSESLLDRLRKAVDIVELIDSSVELRKASPTSWVGLCPFHDEETPSFSVQTGRSGYFCFGCKASGDAISWVQYEKGMSFPDAVRSLCRLTGIECDDGVSVTMDEKTDAKSSVLKIAAHTYYEALMKLEECDSGRRYAKRRGLTSETCKSFIVGYAPHQTELGWSWLADKLVQRGEEYVNAGIELGLVARSKKSVYDKFRGRLVMPICDRGGEVVGLTGRILPDHDDEQNSKYLLTKMAKGSHLYGIQNAGKAMLVNNRAIVVEGPLDAMMMHQNGFTETVASLGSSLSQDQVRLLQPAATTVYMLYDNDIAGESGALSAVESIVSAGRFAMICSSDRDPSDCLKEHVEVSLKSASDGILNPLDRMPVTDSPAITGEHIDRSIKLVAKISSSIVRSIYADQIALLGGVRIESVEKAIEEARS